MRVHALQHSVDDGPGTLADALTSLGHALSLTRLDRGETPPAPAAFDALVVLGGPMNLHQHLEFPWLLLEKAYLKQILASDRRILGICLGAQLLADALGGDVRRAPQRERGWWPVTLSQAGRSHPMFAGLDPEFSAFHWHEDGFSLPAKIESLAHSAVTPHQAFAYDENRVVGLQFHPEITVSAAQRWFGLAPGPVDPNADDAVSKDDWPATATVQSAQQILHNTRCFTASQTLMAQLAKNFFGCAR